MKKLFTWMSTLLLALMMILPSACTLPWMQEEDEFDITSKFKAVRNVHEKIENHSDGSITYESVRWGGLVGLVKEHNLPVDWSNYESVTFEFEDTTQVQTQILMGSVLRAWGKKGIKKLSCYFDGIDVKQVDEIVLQTANPTKITIKSVRLAPVTTSWNSTPIWEGECEFGNWEGGFVIDAEKFSAAKEGDKLEFVFTTNTKDQKLTYWQMKPIYDGTDQTLEGNKSEQNDWGCTTVARQATSYRVRLTARDVKELKARGMFTNGFFLKMTQVNLLRKAISGNPEDVEGEGDGEKKEQKGYKWE